MKCIVCIKMETEKRSCFSQSESLENMITKIDEYESSVTQENRNIIYKAGGSSMNNNRIMKDIKLEDFSFDDNLP